MVSSRKRSFQEVDKEDVQAPKEPSLLQRIRNMWQLANIAQFLAIFGPAVKIEPPDMDVRLFNVSGPNTAMLIAT